MFCSNCGKAVVEGANFCDGCGAPIFANENTEVPVVRPQPAKMPNPMFENFVKRIKGFFSLNAVKTVGEAAQSTGMEWLLLAGMAILAYTLAFAANIGQLVSSMFGSFLSDGMYNFGWGLVFGFLFGSITYFLMSALIFLIVKVIYKKQVSIIKVFNMVAVASMPLACVYTLNILCGFVWMPLVVIFSVSGLVATSILLYAGMQKLAKFETSPFLAYVCIWSIVVTVVCIVLAIVANYVVDSMVSSLVGNSYTSLLNNAIGTASEYAEEFSNFY